MRTKICGGGNTEDDKHDSDHRSSQLRQYIHDIRNTKTFDMNTLRRMNTLAFEERMEIFMVYNEMMSYYLSLFED